MVPCAVTQSFHKRCLSMDLELHGQSCCCSCCSDAEHEPAPLESWNVKSLFARNATGKIFSLAALAAQQRCHREGTADIWHGRQWWQWHTGKGLQPRAGRKEPQLWQQEGQAWTTSGNSASWMSGQLGWMTVMIFSGLKIYYCSF